MKRLLLPALLLAGCGGSGSNVDPNLYAAAQCSSNSLGDLNVVFQAISEFLLSIGATLPSNVTYDPGTGDFSITTSLGTIDGNLSSTDDISNGIDPGESASATWSLNPAMGMTVGGAGVFTLARTATQVFAITGNGSIVDGLCLFNATNVDLGLDLGSGLGPTGSFDFDAVTPSGPMNGTMTFDGSDTAVVDATFLTVPVMFTIDLNTFQPSF